MKTELTYSTKISAYITSVRGNVFQCDFFPYATLDECKRWAKNALDDNLMEIPAQLISKISFCDANTAELLMTCERDEEEAKAEDPLEWNFDEDLGFDPYLGEYTYDC